MIVQTDTKGMLHISMTSLYDSTKFLCTQEQFDKYKIEMPKCNIYVIADISFNKKEVEQLKYVFSNLKD